MLKHMTDLANLFSTTKSFTEEQVKAWSLETDVTVGSMFMMKVREFDNANTSLRTEVAMLTQRLERLVQSLDSNLGINTLGEVQGSGSSVDVKCARREHLAQDCRMLAMALEAAASA